MILKESLGKPLETAAFYSSPQKLQSKLYTIYCIRNLICIFLIKKKNNNTKSSINLSGHFIEKIYFQTYLQNVYEHQRYGRTSKTKAAMWKGW